MPHSNRLAKIKHLLKMININLVFSFKNTKKNILIKNSPKIFHLVYIKIYAIIVSLFMLDKLINH